MLYFFSFITVIFTIDSEDLSINNCTPKLKSGSWKVEEAVKTAESDIQHQLLCGKPQFGRTGLGFIKSKPLISNDASHEYRKQVSDCFKEIDDTYSISKAVQLQVQGQWTRWLNYIQQDFSWNSLLATPPNLLSFCISATYDTLPSPSNLLRWRISTEASCFLCNKPTCTTAHILGACKVSLNQGRFTFRHNAVLSKLFDYLKDFISNKKPLSLYEARNNFKKFPLGYYFVTSGAKSPRKKRPYQGILHHSSDWKIISDLSDNYCFPVHIALTELRPDIVIYSNRIKRVVLIELTCPCEENMVQWHDKKFFKYQALKSSIELAGWTADLFTIEVGARGFCSRSLPSTLRALGYESKSATSISGSLAKISMECSFCIWISRNNRDWSNKDHENNMKKHHKNNKKSKSDLSKLANVPPNVRKTDNIKSKNLPVGFINKGNTCYANSILQAFSAVPLLWSFASSHSSQISPLMKAISLNMTIKQKALKPVDPSNFLWALQRQMSTLNNNTQFNFNSQQDVPEILQVILNEIQSASPIADDIFTISIKSTVTCDTCLSYSEKVEKHNILTVPMSSDISSSISSLLQPESLSGDNKWFCRMCNSLSDSTKETAITQMGSILIIQLIRFNWVDGVSVKDEQVVDCLGKSPHMLKIPMKPTDEVVFSNRYSLLATINHSGLASKGHYWAFTKQKKSGWFSCNDKYVIPLSIKSLKNKSVYVLFYERV